MFTKKQKKRKPFEELPLRYEGQSLDEKIDKVLNEKMFLYLVIASFFLLAIMFQWIYYFSPIKRPPYIGTVFYLTIVIFMIWKFIKKWELLKKLKLGRLGERYVGQFLTSMTNAETRVFHDIQGKNFNIDHVIISTKGIYVIETKTFSKPEGRRAEVTFDGKDICIDGIKNQGKIIKQSKAATNFIRSVLEKSLGYKVKVFPVILFPGWWIAGRGNTLGKMWVLNHKLFQTYFNKQKSCFDESQYNQIVDHLTRYLVSEQQR